MQIHRDLSDLANPPALGSYATQSPALDIQVVGSRASIATDNGMAIVDVSDPRHPATRSSDTTRGNVADVQRIQPRLPVLIVPLAALTILQCDSQWRRRKSRPPPVNFITIRADCNDLGSHESDVQSRERANVEEIVHDRIA